MKASVTHWLNGPAGDRLIDRIAEIVASRGESRGAEGATS